MCNKRLINGFVVKMIPAGFNRYKICFFNGDTFESYLHVSLQPTGNSDELPTYQIWSNSQSVPDWANEYIADISDWVKNELNKSSEQILSA